MLYFNGKPNEIYDETIFDDNSNCRNGNLNIINNSKSDFMLVKYADIPTIAISNIQVNSRPNY